ncbi:MAG: hypothetical protein D6722_20130 [Bacteroidetes bacterium]|nr:MAG: hypothetical protein D6722_20130 [Bacteroidota bacterium]
MEPNDIERLDRQLQHSGFYTHTILSRYAERINDQEAFLYGLIDYLIEQQGLDGEALKSYVARVRDELRQRKEALSPGVTLRIDKPLPEGEAEVEPVNCADRLPICQAVCCKLNFALSPQEVESGKIKWELGHPYFIRHEQDGYCSHIDHSCQGCGIYEDRPRVCRRYSCAHDARIWKDFEKMKLNTEWIEAHLGPRQPRLFFVNMDPEAPV